MVTYGMGNSVFTLQQIVQQAQFGVGPLVKLDLTNALMDIILIIIIVYH